MPVAEQSIHRDLPPSPWTSGDSLRGALLWFALTLGTAALGGLASSQAPEVYGKLVQPEWAPPASVFGPVWSLLYILMAVAAWQVWRYRRTVAGSTGLALYAVALVPNALWSWLFFNQLMGAWALLDLVVLWALIAFTVRLFWRVRPLFGALLLPLWAWVSFAGVLNAMVWLANPALLG
jgi:benzodiazapine receptor